MPEQKSANGIVFSSYAMQQTGILCNRCKLLISDYVLACVPYKLSKKEAEILLSLDDREYVFFNEYRKKFCFLSIGFQHMHAHNIDESLVRTELLNVIPLKSRQNTYAMMLKILSCPSDLSSLIDDYFKNYDKLQEKYDNFKSRFIFVDIGSRARLPVCTYTIDSDSKVLRYIQIYKFSTQQIVFLVHQEEDLIPADTHVTVRFRTKSSRFDIPGKIVSIQEHTPEMLSMTSAVEFSPEFTEIVSTYLADVADNTYISPLF